jgi:hypothetical protein
MMLRHPDVACCFCGKAIAQRAPDPLSIVVAVSDGPDQKKSMTAAEFAAQLKQDPEYLAKQAEQAQRAAQAEGSERVAMQYLASHGYPANSFQDLLQRYSPIPEDLANALLDLLSEVDNPNVVESIVRALGATRSELDPSPLIKLFEQTQSENLRWAIANTFAEARPRSAGEWILGALQQKSYGRAREMLALAAARTNTPDRVNPVIVQLLGELPGHAALALAESGTTAELPPLERAYANSRDWHRKELGRAIAVIRTRTGMKT